MGLDNPLHILALLLLVLLVFGAKRLPEIGRSLGTGLREFKQSVTGDQQQSTLTAAQPQPTPAPSQQVPTPTPPAQQTPTPPPAS
jgi:sec-independent protein translocase protein TatA